MATDPLTYNTMRLSQGRERMENMTIPALGEHKPPDHNERMLRARAEAEYQLGDSLWANTLIDIYTGEVELSEDAEENYLAMTEGDDLT